MELCIGYLYIIIITFSWKTCKVQGNTDHSLVKPLDIVKRYLRWNNNGYIVPSEGSSYEVMYLQPHPANVAVKSDGNYLAFTLYMRNGREEAQNTGVFHFIDADIANEKRSHCTRKAMHEGAYYHFYGKCPENEQRIVASGYCYQGSNGRGLVYNSITFNSVAMTYVDGRYYLNTDRTVHPYEENLIKVCFNNWKDSGFQVHSWKCATKDVPFASGLTSDFGKRSKRASTTLATAVVQLYLADSDNTQEWNKICCGVACFVKDNPNRSFFICIYDNTSQQKIWEQELYIQYKYHTPRDFFHTFEADDCQAALNFASVDEAEMFMTAIQQKILDRHNKRIQKRKLQDGGNRITPPQQHGNTMLMNPAPQLPISTKKSGSLKSKSTDKGKGKGRKKLTKADISTPTDFRHVGHVGWDPNCGLQMDKLDPQMKALFMEIGIDEQSQVDEDTVNFIYDFVDKHGGLNAVKEDLARRKPEPSAPIDYSSSNRNQGSSLPSKPNFAPPKPPSSRSALPPIPPSRAGHSSSVSKEGVPPAPPLPPSAPPAYYAPPPPHSKPSNESRSPPVCSGRSGLLDDIVKFKGSALKPVDHSQVDRSAAPAVEATGGIASALMDALNKRKPALQCSDDDDEESDDLDDDDDEWDD